ncbi:hypothetical protein [Kiloniella majae]|uniref:hypothetical protein n=1 Tax=Kiloniella majae TaxID=1938558 RepID=UPI000A278B18|nr:hypothetical protein [Kiloniella majae]
MALDQHTSALATRVGQEIKSVRSEMAAPATGGGLFIFAMEENSSLNTGRSDGFQFSIGNGADQRQGITLSHDMTAIGLSVSTGSNATGVIELYKNGTGTGATISLDDATSAHRGDIDVPFAAGDLLTFRTISGSGGSYVTPSVTLETQGVTGKSAYQIWLDEGNSGIKADFIASLSGAQGPEGPQGPQGQQGPAGDAGAGLPTGGTTGQIPVKNSDSDFDIVWGDAASGGGGLTHAPSDGRAYVSKGGAWDSLRWSDMTGKPQVAQAAELIIGTGSTERLVTAEQLDNWLSVKAVQANNRPSVSVMDTGTDTSERGWAVSDVKHMISTHGGDGNGGGAPTKAQVESVLTGVITSHSHPGAPQDGKMYGQFNGNWAIVGEMPIGGTTGQYMRKKSNTNFDIEWVDAPSGGSTPTRVTSDGFQEGTSTTLVSWSPKDVKEAILNFVFHDSRPEPDRSLMNDGIGTSAVSWNIEDIKYMIDTHAPNNGGLPSGGTAGQVLSKVDSTDGNAAWTDISGDPYMVLSDRGGSLPTLGSETISAMAIGSGAKAMDSFTIALGLSSEAGNISSITVGAFSKALGYKSIALGETAQVETAHQQSVAIGAGAKTTAAKQMVLGATGDNALTVRIPKLAGNGDGVVSVNNDGDLAWSNSSHTSLARVAGEDLSLRDLCVMGSDGKMYKVSTSEYDKVGGLLGFSSTNLTAGQSGDFVLAGILGGFSNLTIGKYYIEPDRGLPGAITVTKPTANGQYVREIGYAISATEMYIKISDVTILLNSVFGDL